MVFQVTSGSLRRVVRGREQRSQLISFYCKVVPLVWIFVFLYVKLISNIFSLCFFGLSSSLSWGFESRGQGLDWLDGPKVLCQYIFRHSWTAKGKWELAQETTRHNSIKTQQKPLNISLKNTKKPLKTAKPLRFQPNAAVWPSAAWRSAD